MATVSLYLCFHFSYISWDCPAAQAKSCTMELRQQLHLRPDGAGSSETRTQQRAKIQKGRLKSETPDKTEIRIIEPSGFWLASKGVREDRPPLRIEAAGAGGGAREARLWLAWFSSAQV